MLIILQIYIFVLPFAVSQGSPWHIALDPIYAPSFLVFLGIWAITKGLALKKIGSVRYPVILFFVSLIISFTFSTDRAKSFQELYAYALALLLFLVISPFSGEDKMRVVKTLLLSGLLVCILAIHQYFVVFPELIAYLKEKKIVDPFLVHFVAQKRVLFPFTTPNILGGYLATLLPLALLPVEGKIFFLVTMGITLLLTQSLSGLLSVFFAFAVFFSMKGQFNKTRSLFFLSAVGLTIALVFFLRTVRSTEYLQPLFSWTMRFDYWREAVKIIAAHPFTGVGLGNFDLPQCRFAHNSYLQIWGEMGILGIFSYLWLVGSVLWGVIKQMKDPAQKSGLVLLVTSLAAFLFHNVLDFSFFLPEVGLIGWMLLGLLNSTDREKPQTLAPARDWRAE